MGRRVWGALALFVGMGMSGAGCEVAQVVPPAESTPTPEPEPTVEWSNDTYAAALRSASIKLRGRFPSASEALAVREGGRQPYQALIETWLDPVQNPRLDDQLKSFYQSLFLMSGVEADEGTSNPDPYGATNTNYDLPSNLATWVFVNDRPVTELLTSDECIGSDLQPLSPLMAANACEGAPKDAVRGNHRAGVIGMRPFLRKYGQPNTLNLRRTSLVHQIFNCEKYPDGADPTTLVRTNDVTADPGDNTDPQYGSLFYPLNDNDTAMTGDDFADPYLGHYSTDPAFPYRISKKYQTEKGGMSCHACHGKLNQRRTIFTPYTPEGRYDDYRSMAHTRGTDGSVDNNVESPEQNNGADYCGALGDTEAVDGVFGVGNGDPNDDDVDPGAFECQENGRGPAIYHGREVRTLREYGYAIADEELTGGRFQQCMTTRHVNFVLGLSQGQLGMQAGAGTSPAMLPGETLAKFMVVYESQGWSTRGLMHAVFLSDEFLSTQQR